MISLHENHVPQEFGPQMLSEDEIIYMIKDYGPFSSEALDTLHIWLINKGKEHNESESEYSQLKFNMDVASLCLKTGLIDDVYRYSNQAWDFVTNFKFRGNELTD
jgi:hypothetical protein